MFEGLSIEDDRDSIITMIVDIVYAYQYEMRMLRFEEISSETPKNMVRLSSTMSAFVDFSEAQTLEIKLRAAYIGNIRRALVFTLYRSYDLAIRVFEDMIESALKNHSHLISRIAHIEEMFSHGKFKAYNKCYISRIK